MISADFRKKLAYWSCVAAYVPASDQFSQVLTVEDVTILIRYEGPDTVIIFPGSRNDDDWRDDLEWLPHITVPQLGPLHRGFWKFIPEVGPVVKPLIRGDVYIGGHSLGGAHAAGLAAWLGTQGIRTKFLAMFEAPRVGWMTFVRFLETWVDDAVLTWNGLDPVGMLPPPPWRDNWGITRLEGSPGGLDDLKPFAYHRGQVVCDAYCASLRTDSD